MFARNNYLFIIPFKCGLLCNLIIRVSIMDTRHTITNMLLQWTAVEFGAPFSQIVGEQTMLHEFLNCNTLISFLQPESL